MALHFRVLFALLLTAARVISGTYRRQARSSSETIPRVAEGGSVLLARMTLALPVLAVFLILILRPAWLFWAAYPSPDWLRWLGVVLGFICLFQMIWVFRSIGSNISETLLTKQDHRLVTTGAYRRVRHPLYATALLLILCLALLSASWLLHGFWLIALIIFRLIVIPAEERNLSEKFGAEYEAYRAQSGALIPRFGL